MGRLKFRIKPGLFAEFVCCDSIELFVPFDRNYLLIVCVDAMITSFSKEVEGVLFQIAD